MLGYLCQPSETLPTKLSYFTVMYRNNGHCQDLNSSLDYVCFKLCTFYLVFVWGFLFGGGGTVLIFVLEFVLFFSLLVFI